MLCTWMIMLHISFFASLHFKLFKDIYFFIYIWRASLKAASIQPTIAFIKTELQLNSSYNAMNNLGEKGGMKASLEKSQSVAGSGHWLGQGQWGPGTVGTDGGVLPHHQPPAYAGSPAKPWPCSTAPTQSQCVGMAATAPGSQAALAARAQSNYFAGD